MGIKIVEDGPDITLTRSEHTRFMQEYQRAYQLYAGPVPTFEEFVRNRLNEQKAGKRDLLTELSTWSI